MRVVNIRPLNNWFGFVLFWLGVVMLYLTWNIVKYNNLTNAAFMVSALGGEVIVTESQAATGGLELPAIQVVRAGVLGLSLARTVGWLIVALQVFFWSTEKGKLGQLDRAVTIGMIALLVGDFFTVMFFLLGGPEIGNLFMGDWVAFMFVRLPVASFLAITVLSLGAELWMALAIELIRTQYEVGLGAILNGLKAVGRGMRDFFKNIKSDGGGGGSDNGHDDEYDDPRSRYTPRREPERQRPQPPRPQPPPARNAFTRPTPKGGFTVVGPEEVEQYR